MRMRSLVVLPAIFFTALPAAIDPDVAAPAATARSLSFEQRIAAQHAIEEVYWRHRIWPDANPTPKPVLPSVLSDEAIRSKVEDYLKKSNALEKWWHPVTAEQLQLELDRMSRDTRDPEMLRDLYAALGQDAFLVAETLGRQTLVERLVRERYARDDRCHGELERSARHALAGVHEVAAMRALGGQYAETTYRVRAPGDERSERDLEQPMIELDADGWEDWQTTLAGWFGTTATDVPLRTLSRLQEERDQFLVVAVLSRTADRVTVASVVWPKRSFDAWWGEQTALLTAELSIDPQGFTLAEPQGAGCMVDTWRELYYSPAARSGHTAVWTGTEMIVWGGTGGAFLNDGGRYNASTDSWIPVSNGSHTPAGRYFHTAVWTGTEMIVWGGTGGQYHGTGGRYDPVTDSWSTVTQTSAPSGRAFHTAAWTGTEMVIWGGKGNNVYYNTGGRYDPSANTWVATSLGANVPSDRSGHVAVWTGTDMIVWGGHRQSGVNDYYHQDGARYRPGADIWFPISAGANVPSERHLAEAVWTGTEMIVWGGHDGDEINTGGRYDPSTDSWASMSTGTGSPEPRYSHTATWTGTEMIVWGGFDGVPMNNGGRYDPSTDSWVSTSTGSHVASPRYSHTAVWTGTEMIVWGGGLGNSFVETGSRYDPSMDQWTPTSLGSDVPTPRHTHTAVWTGTEMIVWGGYGAGAYLNTGGRYDLSTDTWFPTPTGTDAPSGRYRHTAVWTGTEMIVWGGYAAGVQNSGGRYDPSTNSWMPTTIVGVPERRDRHTAVWTGTEMIVWGGSWTSYWNTGGRYDPSTDTWLATSTGTAVPWGRRLHTAVWTGTEMIVWGGYGLVEDEAQYHDTGGRYDPSSDTWTATALNERTPAGRQEQQAVWTGTEMIVWGGSDGDGVATGGRYDPANDLWQPTSNSWAPSARHKHAAVWTGSEMIVWGGREPYPGPALDTGGRYDPSNDIWWSTSTETTSAMLRYDHTAVWTGAEMIIWGGSPSATTLSFYCASACTGPAMGFRDADGDGFGNPADFVVTDGCSIPAGFVPNADDCDDGNAATYSGADEINDGEDNQCPGDPGFGVADEISGDAGFQNPADEDEYSWPAQSGAVLYEVARSTDPGFSTDCTTITTGDTFWVDSTRLPRGVAFHYLVRATAPNAGSWGQDSGGVERNDVCP